MLGANAQHPECAYMWMNHSLTPKLQGDLAAWFGSVPVVLDACKDNALLGAEGCKTNGLDNFEKIRFWRTPETKCADGRGDICIPYRKWVTDYLAVIGGR
jgi:putative spermidine/putrescine transport system substrate-binding protein